MSEIGWRFGSLDFGRKEGLNDSSVSFKGSQLFSSLPKEIIQNSIDARSNQNKPVEVKFEMQKWKKENIPGCNELERIFESCKDSWDGETIKEFFDNALSVLNQERIPVLKVSDYNTTGLVGSNDARQQSPWYSLVKATGVSDKKSGSGGSYGVGKTAPIINSEFRTLLYHTIDENGIEATQGVASLVSHQSIEEQNDLEVDSFTQNVGYYGYKKRSKHLNVGKQLSEKLVRTEAGTDIYVLAYKEHNDWKNRMIKSVMEIFFVAILENILVVEVEGVIINKNTIGDLIREYDTGKKSDYLLDFYKVYTAKEDGEKKFVIPIELEVQGIKLNGINLHLLIEDGLKKRVCKMRGNRMVIRNRTHEFIRDYDAILVAHGEEINNQLKLLESPQHDKWDVNMNEKDKKFGEELLKELRKAYKNAIKEKMNIDTTDAVQLQTLNEILPSNLFDFENRNRKYTKPEVRDTKVMKKPSTPITAGGPIIGEGKSKGSTKKEKKSISCVNRFAAMIDRKKGEYIIKVTPGETKKGYITVYQVGEDIFVPVELNYAKKSFMNVSLPPDKIGKIGPIDFIENKQEVYKIKLKGNLRCALEVRLNED